MHSISRRYFAFAGLLAPIALAHATPAPEPSNPEVRVPAAPYQSALQNYQPAPAVSASPDQVWRRAIAALASEPDHADMAGMNMGGAMPTPMPMPKADAGSRAEPDAKPDAMPMPMATDKTMPTDQHQLIDMTKPMPVPGQDVVPAMHMHHGHAGEK